MSKRVLLHVGCPKTGTSYLQDVLFRNQQVLREHDILYPADRFDAHFLAALDLMTLPWGGLETEAVGAWDRLAAQVREWPGTSIISHEIFARATPTQVDRALGSLGDAEVHLVLSVRDLVRQIPAEWQENVKHRSHITYARFLQTDPRPGARLADRRRGSGPCRSCPTCSTGGATTLPPERVHLVTVPPPGADRGRAVAAVLPHLRARRPRPRPDRRAREPVAGRARDLAAAHDQPAGDNRRSRRPTTGRWSASCSPTRRCRAASPRPGSGSRPTTTRGPRS